MVFTFIWHLKRLKSKEEFNFNYLKIKKENISNVEKG
jgi:hypothetical protein